MYKFIDRKSKEKDEEIIMLIIVSGSSGVGKNTVLNELFKKYPNYKNLVSCTTRGIREGEVEGLYYNYLTKEEFLKLHSQGEFAEYEEIHGNYYGMRIKDIDEAIKSEEIYIKDLGVEGAQNMQAIAGKENLLSIFIDAPKEVLRERLEGRGETQIDLRLSRYDYEHQYIKNYDYVVQNIDLLECVQEVDSVIKHYKMKKKREIECTKKGCEQCLGK